MKNFDTVVELGQIKDLYDLNEALKVRTEAFISGQTLHNFVFYIGGIQLLFDNTGGLLEIRGKNPVHYVYEVAIMLWEEMSCYSKNSSTYTYIPLEIPDADIKCDYCHEKWTLKNFLNKVSDEKSNHYHRECERQVIKIRKTGNIEELVKKSGLGFNSMDFTDHYPFKVITQYGFLSIELIKGYTVMNWQGMYKAKEISLIFEKEQTIRNGNSICASSEEKVLEYLTKIYNFYKHK